MKHLGIFDGGDTVEFKFNTYNQNGASVAPSANGTVRVYRQGNSTPVTTGVTVTNAYNSITGLHNVSISTADGFYTTGNDYTVELEGATIDGQTVNATLASFSLRNRYNVSTTYLGVIASTVWGNTSRTLTSISSFLDSIADAVLARSFSSVSSPATFSLLNAARLLRNRWNTTVTPGTLTVYEEDGTTVAWTRTVSTDAAANPIVGVN